MDDLKEPEFDEDLAPIEKRRFCRSSSKITLRGGFMFGESTSDLHLDNSFSRAGFRLKEKTADGVHDLPQSHSLCHRPAPAAEDDWLSRAEHQDSQDWASMHQGHLEDIGIEQLESLKPAINETHDPETSLNDTTATSSPIAQNSALREHQFLRHLEFIKQAESSEPALQIKKSIQKSNITFRDNTARLNSTASPSDPSNSVEWPLVNSNSLPVSVAMPYLDRRMSNDQQLIPIPNNTIKMLDPYLGPQFNASGWSSLDQSAHSLNGKDLLANQIRLRAFEIPQVTLSRSEIDFGEMAESFCDRNRFYLVLDKLPVNVRNAFFLIDSESPSEWTIEELCEPSESGSKRYNTFNDLRIQLTKALSLSTSQERGGGKKSLSFEMSAFSNFFEFFVHLNLKDVNYFGEMVASRTEDMDLPGPAEIRTELLVFYCFNDSQSMHGTTLPQPGDHPMTSKHLVTKIPLQFVLGYVDLRISAGFKAVLFDLPNADEALDEDQDGCLTDPQEAHEQVADRTLVSSTDSVYLKRNVDERFIRLTNHGNIDVDLNCYFNLGNEHDNGACFITIDDSYELRLERSMLTIGPGSSRSVRILAHLVQKAAKTQPQLTMSMSEFQRIGVNLIIVTSLESLSFTIPINVRVQSSAIEAGSGPTPHTLVPCSTPVLVSNIAPGRTPKTCSLPVNATRRILLFDWPVLGPRVDDDCSYSSFKAQNFDQPTRLEMTIESFNGQVSNLSMLRGGKAGPDILSANKFFQFHKSMLASSITPAKWPTEITLQIEPGQLLVVKLVCMANLVAASSMPSPICHGIVRVRNLESEKKNDIYLVGSLLKPAVLGIESVTSLEPEEFIKRYMKDDDEENSLRKHLRMQKSPFFTYLATIEMAIASSGQLGQAPTHRKLLTIKNQSAAGKCLVYPMLFNSDMSQPLGAEQRSEASPYEKWYPVGSHAASYLKVLYQPDKTRVVESSTGEFVWIELNTGEANQISLELTTPSDLLDDEATAVSLVLFWMDHDIGAYCALNAKHLKAHQWSESRTPTFLKDLSNRILNLTRFDSPQSNQRQARSSQGNQDDYLRLIRSALKCTLIRVQLTSNHLIIFRPPAHCVVNH